MPDTTRNSTTASVIRLAERAGETLDVTELEPYDGTFIGKHINADGSITQYPHVTWWRQSVAVIPATIPGLFAYLCEARKRNICLIRGAPANVERERTRRQYAYEYNGEDRGDHGFLDEPTKLLWFDVDGIPMQWRGDPEGAIKKIVAQLGEPWCSTSCVWFFSATHGLARDKDGCWTGKISDDKVRARLGYIAERALGWEETVALTHIAQVYVPQLDPAISRVVQPNYIARPHWVEHPDRDPLGDIPTIGRIKGARECLAVPDDLTYTARWAKAQGLSSDMADHLDAETAVRSIGSDGTVRPHVKSAVLNLLLANPAPDVVSFADHAVNIVAKLRSLIEQHRGEIVAHLVKHGRGAGTVDDLLRHSKTSWAYWLLNHQAALRAKTIKLVREDRVEPDDTTTREAIFARVARVIDRARKGEAPVDLDPFLAFGLETSETPVVELLVAPPGSRKSTLSRAAAVQFVAAHPGQSVLILVPTNKLSDEQIKDLKRAHPDSSGAIWRGMLAWNPDVGNGREEKMCLRPEEAKELQDAMLNVGSTLCKQGRGEKTIKCPFFDRCGYQGQKEIVEAANIIFSAHEMIVHEMPKAFGDVGWVILDESPLDAFMVGVDINDQMMLELDALREPPTGLEDREADELMDGRNMLYRELDKLQVPIDRHKGIPASKESLRDFEHGTLWDARTMYSLEWRGKVGTNIKPDMTARQVRKELEKAVDNPRVKKRAALWRLIEQANESEHERHGRVQVQRKKEGGRIIRMVGLRDIVKAWNVPTLITDATGDRELLKAVWPGVIEAEPHGWQQLPRPKSVKISQLVDCSYSKWMIAVESKNKKAKDAKEELKRKAEAARAVYAAVLCKALAYSDAKVEGKYKVALITYKSTEDWIRENCFVPHWLAITHFGDVAGSNALEHVRGLFVVGRPLPAGEDVSRIVEALFGKFVSRRDYVQVRKGGRIPIVPDAKGKNVIKVDVWRHQHPMGERVKRQACEGAIIQAVERARAGLRTDEAPLNIHLWTDTPVPEIGPVEPVLRDEIEAETGLDGLMLATGGMWLESPKDAAQAYRLFSAPGLKRARERGGDTPVTRSSYNQSISTSLSRLRFRRQGRGQRPARALTLLDPAYARAWLEEKLGPLASFEVLEHEGLNRQAGGKR